MNDHALEEANLHKPMVKFSGPKIVFFLIRNLSQYWWFQTTIHKAFRIHNTVWTKPITYIFISTIYQNNIALTTTLQESINTIHIM